MIAFLTNLKSIIVSISGAIAIGWLGIKIGENRGKEKAKLSSEEKANEKLHEMLDAKEKVGKLDRDALLRILSSKK